MGNTLIDLSNKKFGRLTVKCRATDYITPNGKKEPQWMCDCECGNVNVIVRGRSLRSGTTSSCGCLKRELSSSRLKKYNRYEFFNDNIIGYTLKNEMFIIDKEDYELVKQYCWYLNKDGYVSAKCGDKHILLSRLVSDCDTELLVDHINHNKLDNRKRNLRICNNKNNCRNKKLMSTNVSGYPGIFIKNNSYQVYILGKYQGTFYNIDDALALRKSLEEKYYGEYSYDNSMKISKEYEIKEIDNNEETYIAEKCN